MEYFYLNQDSTISGRALVLLLGWVPVTKIVLVPSIFLAVPVATSNALLRNMVIRLALICTSAHYY